MGGDSYRCDACRRKVSRCSDCAARRAEIQRARRARYRKAGLCSECGRKAVAGQSRCAEHRDENNTRSGAAHAARRADEE